MIKGIHKPSKTIKEFPDIEDMKEFGDEWELYVGKPAKAQEAKPEPEKGKDTGKK